MHAQAVFNITYQIVCMPIVEDEVDTKYFS